MMDLAANGLVSVWVEAYSKANYDNKINNKKPELIR